MENQNKIVTSKPSRISVEIYIENAKGVKVRELSDLEGLVGTLRYCIVLLGIREQNMPSKPQFQVLIDFVKTQLGKYTLEEIKLAFQMAVARKLEVDPNTYQNFTSVFITEVMRGYDKHIHRQGFNRSELNQLPETKTDMTNEIIEMLNFNYKESVRTKTNDFQLECVKAGTPYIEFASAMYNQYYRDVHKLNQEQQKEIRVIAFSKIKEKYKGLMDNQDKELFEFLKGQAKEGQKYFDEWVKICRVVSFEKMLNKSIEEQNVIEL